jgi:hypothetical protein
VRKESVGRTSVPDLGFYPLIIHRDYASGKLDTNRRPALSIEFVAYEPREHYDYEMSAAVMSCSPNTAYVQLLCGWKREGKKTLVVVTRQINKEGRTTFRHPSHPLGEPDVTWGKTRFSSGISRTRMAVPWADKKRSCHLEEIVVMVSLSHLRTRKKNARMPESRCLLKYLAPPYVWRLHRRDADAGRDHLALASASWRVSCRT